jgi:hypothetical protein
MPAGKTLGVLKENQRLAGSTMKCFHESTMRNKILNEQCRVNAPSAQITAHVFLQQQSGRDGRALAVWTLVAPLAVAVVEWFVSRHQRSELTTPKGAPGYAR